MRKKTAIVGIAVSFALLLALAVSAGGCGASPDDEASGSEATATAAVPFVVTSPVSAVDGAMPTMNKHAERNVTCAQCHDESAPTTAPLSNKACYSCHDLETLIEATAAYDDLANKSQNPHDSHLYGASCFTCHKNHGESVLYCDECHLPAYGWDVP